MNIAVLGPKGTFSDKVYLKYDKLYNKRYGEHLTPVYCSTIDDVFEHVCPEGDEKDICELGIVPIENTLDGYVLRTLDLLLEKSVFVVGENMVSVQFSCIANAKGIADIERLYVQFKANGQCRRFINSLTNASIIATESNMESCYKVGTEKNAAAIVPAHIAKDAANELVVSNVTDSDSNHTRFFVFKKEENVDEAISSAGKNIAETKVRIPVYIMPRCDRPGVLYEITKIFFENKINLISIISRPTKQDMGHYNFYIEIDGHFDRLNIILSALNELKKSNDIKILGIYGEH